MATFLGSMTFANQRGRETIVTLPSFNISHLDPEHYMQKTKMSEKKGVTTVQIDWTPNDEAMTQQSSHLEEQPRKTTTERFDELASEDKAELLKVYFTQVYFTVCRKNIPVVWFIFLLALFDRCK